MKKQEEKPKKTIKKTLRKMLRKESLLKMIIVVSSIALIAASILPYMLR